MSITSPFQKIFLLHILSYLFICTLFLLVSIFYGEEEPSFSTIWIVVVVFFKRNSSNQYLKVTLNT